MTKDEYQAFATRRTVCPADLSQLPDCKFALNYVFQNRLCQKLFNLTRDHFEGLLCFPRLNAVYRMAASASGSNSFPDKIINAIRVHYQVAPRDLQQIPRKGSVVVVANHPFGAIEGLVLMSVVSSVRQDAKLIGNFLLRGIEELRESLIYVDPFGKNQSTRRNIIPIRQSIQWLKTGHSLIVFPAGAVSHFRLRGREVTDPEWSASVARIVRKTQSSVLPIFFSGNNSNLFQMLGLVHPGIRTALLPQEFFKKSGQTIELRVGKLIPFDSLAHLQTDPQLISYLRARTYLLKYRERHNAFPVRVFASKPEFDDTQLSMANETWPSRCKDFLLASRNESPRRVVREIQPELLADEVDSLPARQMLVNEREYAAFWASSSEIPNLLQEIGRLRELTFRECGEGTGESKDIDRFDLYYKHLFLWNKVANEMVGAYRIGHADEILLRFGKAGLYTSTLFKYQPALLSRLRNGLELGRSFVRAKYQKSFQPLFYLWRGISRYVAKHPQYFLLFGPVSISDNYQPISKLLMLEYLKRNHHHRLGRLVSPQMPFRVGINKSAAASLVPMIKDVAQLSSIVSDIEVDKKHIPVLLRQYIRFGGRFLGFNVDPKFGNTVDGLIMTDLRSIPSKLLSTYMGKAATNNYLNYHRSRSAPRGPNRSR